MNVPESQTTEYSHKSKDALIDASMGRPNFDPPADIVEAAISALREGGRYHHYGPVRGYPDLQESIKDYIEEWAGVRPKSVVNCPAKHGIYMAILALSGKSTKFAIIDPAWVSYRPMIEMCKAKEVTLRLSLKEENKVNDKFLEKLSLLGKDDVLILNSPNNPVGYVLDEEGLKAIAETFKGFIISDDVYHELNFTKKKVHISKFLESDRYLIVDSLSKSFGMDGWRIGYVANENKEIMTNIANAKSQTITCVPPFMVAAMKYAIQNKPLLTKRLDELRKRRNMVCSALTSLDKELGEKTGDKYRINYLTPEGGIYIFPQFLKNDKPVDEVKLFYDLLSNGVGSIPGSVFCKLCKGHMRFSFGSVQSEKIGELVQRIGNTIAERAGISLK